MAQASYMQSSFLGGLWSGFHQGRTDDPRYPISLARCFNAMPVEEGAWVRRSGFMQRAVTRNGLPAVLRAFRFSQIAAFNAEISDRNLRIWSDGQLVSDNATDVSDISTDDPAELTVSQVPDNWRDGDTVFLEFDDLESLAYAPVLSGRHFRVVLVDSVTVTLRDAVSNDDIDGTGFAGTFNGAFLRHVQTVRSPYETDDLQAIRRVQSTELNKDVGAAESKVTFLHGSHQPRSLSSLDTFADGFIAEDFNDGPYLDPPVDIVPLEPNATSGLVQFSLSEGAEDWDVGDTYAKGDLVHTVVEGGSSRYWISLHGSNTANQPGDIGGGVPMTDHWAILPSDWSSAISYALGNTVLDFDELTDTIRVYYSLTFSNSNNRPSETPSSWSTQAPTFENGITYSNAPFWVSFNNGLFVGKTSAAGAGPPFDDPPDDLGWIGGLAPTAIFQLFPTINGGRGFIPSDVGRCIRLRSGPAPWAAATAYSTNDEVEFLGNSYLALAGSTGVQPDLDPATWEIQAVGPTWTWARIAYTNQAVSQAISEWVSGGDYDEGEIVAWGAGGVMTNAYVTLIDNNPNEPPTDPTILISGGWVRVGVFVDFDVVDQVVVESWDSTRAYDLGAIVYNGDDTLWVASEDGLDADEEPGADAEWVEVVGVDATIIGTPTSFYAYIEGDPLPNEDDIYLWQLGLYSDTTGWPTSGCYYDARLWLAGPIKNRFDASMSNDLFTFSPTTPDGTVANNNAISRVLNIEDQNDIFWFAPGDGCLVAGTLAGEVIIRASQLEDPITPTSCEARRKTKYGCANVEAVVLPTALGFVQSRQSKFLEYKLGQRGKWTATDLIQQAGSIASGGIEEAVHQAQRHSVIWNRTEDGSLFGISYEREDSLEYYAAHTHEHGHDRTFFSLAVQVDVTGTTENLWAITVDEDDVHYVELMFDVFEEDASLPDAMMVDAGLRPAGIQWVNEGGDDGSLRFFGLWHLRDQVVAAFLGLDLGDFTVSATGTITVPFTEDFTPAMFVTLVSVATDTIFGPGSEVLLDVTDAPFEGELPPLDEGQHYEIAAVVGIPYNSEGQMLRPQDGSQNGPTFGKLRRNHKAALQLWRTAEVSVGPDFTATGLLTFTLRNAGEDEEIGPQELFSGIARDSIEGEQDFDGQLCWRMTRPMPGAVLAIGGFYDPQDI